MTKPQENYNSADERDVAREKRQAHNDTQAEIKDLRATMKSPSGRNTIWRLLTRCGVYQSCFNESSNVMSFKEGERNVGLYYLAMINEHCHADYQKMIQEQHDKT